MKDLYALLTLSTESKSTRKIYYRLMILQLLINMQFSNNFRQVYDEVKAFPILIFFFRFVFQNSGILMPNAFFLLTLNMFL